MLTVRKTAEGKFLLEERSNNQDGSVNIHLSPALDEGSFIEYLGSLSSSISDNKQRLKDEIIKLNQTIDSLQEAIIKIQEGALDEKPEDQEEEEEVSEAKVEEAEVVSE